MTARRFLPALLAALVLACLVSTTAATQSGNIKHVLLISVDGMHALDVANYVAKNPQSALAELASHGITYSNARTPANSDSFPGLLALVTGGSPVSHGLFYDVSYDRTIYDPTNVTCSGPAGNMMVFDESIDLYNKKNVSQNVIDPTKLPRVRDKFGNCVALYPHSALRTNTIFEVAKSRGWHTAWADKHPAYDLVNGPSGTGVDDLYTPEVTNVGGLDNTHSVVCTVGNDLKKVHAIINEIHGLTHDGKPAQGVPVIFGMNFQAVSVGQKLVTDKQKHHHYQLIDMGTFGGPQSWVSGAFEGPAAIVNNAGTVVGGADTSNSNPNYPNVNPFLGPPGLFGYADPFVFQAFKWDEGTLINLGTLPGGANSFADWISGNGLIAGASENGLIDPVNGYPEIHAVLWKDGQIKDLGTLGGGESLAGAVNKRGQVTGGSFDAANNIRAFRWTEDQGLQDLGTLGGCCAIAGTINVRGQISGESGLCDTCNQDAFLWEDGKMYRIPDFGGPISFHEDLNNRGQVVGQSDLPGGANAHAFLWDKKNGVTDLGTLGGSGSVARWINDAGDVVGGASTPNDQAFHATLWKHRDLKIIDLGTVDSDACSVAQNVNSESQVVGLSDAACDGTVLHAFLWENGGPAVDLNTFVPPGSDLQLTQATSINDRGEIAGEAITSNGDNHAFLVIPCDENHSGVEGCDYSLVEGTATVSQAGHGVRNASSRSVPPRLWNRHRLKIPFRATGPTN